jgi:hypothetical protein
VKYKIICLVLLIVSLVTLFNGASLMTISGVPEKILTVSGKVSSAQMIRRSLIIPSMTTTPGRTKGTIPNRRELEFMVEGSDRKFLYPAYYPNFESVVDIVKTGELVDVQYTLDSSETILWDLAVNSNAIIKSQQALLGRRKGASLILLLGFAFAALAAWFWHGNAEDR